MTTGLTPVMQLEADDAASASGTTITVFGTDRKDLTKLGTVRREISAPPGPLHLTATT